MITIPGAWLAINLLAMGIFVVWLTRYMGKLEEKTFGAYTGKFTIDKVCRSRKKLNEFVKKRSKSKCGYQWSDANNGKKKLCWEESDNKVFGPGINTDPTQCIQGLPGPDKIQTARFRPS